MSEIKKVTERNSRANRLVNEKSPYLQQHANNPVNWFPWSDEAFEMARKQDKPIFLSIGYSTCHWCHVMEKESFEDDEVAEMMNETFISIKVDREERPDIDSVYMAVSQMLTGSGGWPLTILMTPDKKPFYAATYIPKQSRYGMPGLVDLLPRIHDLWNNKKEDLQTSANEITKALRHAGKETPGDRLDSSVLKLTFNQLARSYDTAYGGFSNAPKFPTPHNLMFLLRYWKRSDNEKALEMVERTLGNMRMGGIYDHVGFGFHRYSTDPSWLLPHFEKMLYDQALLAIAYLETYQATGKDDYARTTREIFKYVMDEMTGKEGGFYSAEDADSEGEEGKFYLWSEKELNDLLGKEFAGIAIRAFNVKKEGNYIEQGTGNKTGLNILHLTKPLTGLASELGIEKNELEGKLVEIRRRLFEHRSKRVRPHRDDKILTDWNGLMIAAFAFGAQVLGEDGYKDVAVKAADFIDKHMFDKNGGLLHRYREGEAAIPANIDDYAFLIWGLIEIYEATFDRNYLQRAIELNRIMLDRFWDGENGGLYFTGKDSEELLVRQKDVYDGAVPSGNSVALYNLLRLSKLSGDPELESRAQELEKAFSKDIGRIPLGHTMMMVGVDYAVGPAYEVVIRGDEESLETAGILGALRTNFIPNKIVHLNPEIKINGLKGPSINLTLNGSADKSKTMVYICKNYSCREPTSSVDKMLDLLQIRQQG